MTPLFSPGQTDEEVLATVIASYFTPDELEQARELAHTQSYEAAIAYLAQAGQHCLCDSGESQPPRVYLTLPNGTVVIHHPARLAPEAALWCVSVTHLAPQAFPPPSSGGAASTEQVVGHPLLTEHQQQGVSPGHGKKRRPKLLTRPRPCIFVEPVIRIGTKRQFWTRSGWAIQEGLPGLRSDPTSQRRIDVFHEVLSSGLRKRNIEDRVSPYRGGNMGNHNPNAPTFITTMNRFEKTLERFLASDAFQEALIAHATHSRAWLYRHQTLKVRLLPRGTWEINPCSSWSTSRDCVVTLSQVSSHFTKMQEIGEQRDFEQLLNADPVEARKVVERLYANQEAAIKQEIRQSFQAMKQNGRMD